MSDLPRPPIPLSWRERASEAWQSVRDVPRSALVVVVTGTGLAVVVVAMGVALVVGRRPSPPPELSLPRAARADGGAPGAAGAPVTSTTVAGDVTVHVAGAVTRPGVYRLTGGARVTDALAAAGGIGPDSDVDRLNLAAPLADGERVVVPRRGQPDPAPPLNASGGTAGAGGGPAGTGPGSGPVNLNTATAAELDTLPGVGPATAQAILDHRARHGPFRRVDDLLEVRGIGDAKLAQLRPLVTV